MQVKCEYCDNYIDDVAEQCPFCGAPNLNKVRAANRIPRTIAELQAFCAEHNLDLAKMHFHIGEDYRGPRAFGIYEENGRYIVYKNKSDGSRAVRYNGTDEAYAVNEIYQKMKAELNEVRAISASHGGSGVKAAKTRVKGPTLGGIIGAIIAVIVLIFPFVLTIGSCIYDRAHPTPTRGYYTYDDDTYYYGNRGWYYYDDDADDWVYGDVPEGLSGDPSGYWSSPDYDDSYDVPSFSTSDSWDSDNNWDDDWDDDDWDWDSDWDSGGSSSSDWDSWDSGYDWDSDW